MATIEMLERCVPYAVVCTVWFINLMIQKARIERLEVQNRRLRRIAKKLQTKVQLKRPQQRPV